MSKLTFRYSAMNAGKSTQLLQVAHNYEERGMTVIVLKPHADTKGSDYIVSRLGVKRKVDCLIKKSKNIYKLIKKIMSDKSNKYNCILVDEAQFLTRKQVNQLMKVATKLSIPVICYGIRTDFLTKGFEGSRRLLEIAHSLEELKTVCYCGKKAIFNARKVNGTFTFNGEQVCIDDKDSVEYISLCPECYYNEKKKVNTYKITTIKT